MQTAEGDTRVDPLHARKMVALLQAASPCLDERPILLSQEGRAGHGVGKPVSKRADEIADALTFLGAHVGLRRTPDVTRTDGVSTDVMGRHGSPATV